MSKLSTVLIIFFFGHSLAIPYKDKVSVEEYAAFPPFRHLDRFPQCVNAKGGVYCSANFHLTADGPNELLDKLQNFSFSARRHFDYTNPQYGYCITQRCKKFYKGDSDSELLEAMGLCLNYTLGEEYGLRARINYTTCYRHGESKHTVTWLDCAAALIFLTIIGSVIAGTLYDLWAIEKDPNSYLLCFSLPANWARLKAPWPGGQMTARLTGVNGMRTITSMLVILTHSALPIPITIENSRQMEEFMESGSFKFVGQTHVSMQTFLLLSGMFMAYTTSTSNERNPLTWRSLPKAIFFRWYRLAPVYLVTILFCATWFKFYPYGPFWQELVNDEVYDCQKYWTSMFFFLQNYDYGSQCNPHHWSTALDIHMYTLGLILMLLPTEKIRNIALAVTIAIGFALPGIEVYLRDIDGVLMPAGKVVQSQRIFVNYGYFNYMHKRTHTNMTVWLTGMAFGLFLYKWMKKPVDDTKYKKYAVAYWLLFPVMLTVLSLNSLVFLKDGDQASMEVRLLYALFAKPVWGLLIAAFIFGMICRVENVYRRILEWPGWVSLVRLTYCTYNVHMLLIRYAFGADSQLYFLSDFHMLITSMGYITLTFAVSAVMWLCVEQPSNNLIKKIGKKSILDTDVGVKKTQ